MIIDDESAMALAEELEPLFRHLENADDEAFWVSAGKAAFKKVVALQDKLREDYGG